MWRRWMTVILAWVSMATPALCQSGDGDWGSGFGVSTVTAANGTMQAIGDEPVKVKVTGQWSTSGAFLSPSPSPELHNETRADKCSVFFDTTGAGTRRLKAHREELAYLQAIQKGNKMVMENLEQFVGAEMGDHRYQDVIKENVIGIQEEHKSCHEVLEKAEEDLEKQLEGDASDAHIAMQK